jgi:hypothetical protein
MYSDGLELDAGDTGLTLNFTQATKQQSMPVARIGMSYEQVEKVIADLQQTLLRHKYASGPKQLPPTIGSDEHTV